MVEDADRARIALEAPIQTLSAAAAQLERGGPSVFAAPVLDELSIALRGLLDAIDRRDDPRRALELAEAHTLRAVALLDGASKTMALELVASVRAMAIAAPSTSSVAAGALSVWNDRPPAYELQRRSIVPTFRRPPPPRKAAPLPATPAEIDGAAVKTIADLDRAARAFEKLAEATLAEALAPRPSQVRRVFEEKTKEAPEITAPLEVPKTHPPAISRAAFVGRRARELFEELRMAVIHRAPLAGESFMAVHGIERRMMEAVEAFVALGASAFDGLEALACDAPVPDPTYVFGASLLASCVRGRDLFGVVERSLRANGRSDRAMLDAMVEGCSIGSSDDVDAPLVAWTREAGAPLRRAALAALVRRDAVPRDVALTLARDADPEIACLAIAELARARAPETRPLLDALVVQHASSPAAFQPLVRTLAFARDARLVDLATNALATDRDAPLALALALGRDATDPLLRAFAKARKPAILWALGAAGGVRAIPVLLDALRDDDLADAAVRALARITGGSPLEEADVEPEALAEIVMPDPISKKAPAEPAPAIAGSPDHVQRLRRDPDAWAPHVAAVRARENETLRHGAAWSRSSAIDELREARPSPATPLDREWAHLELVYREGARGRFSPSDLVVTQLVRIERLFA